VHDDDEMKSLSLSYSLRINNIYRNISLKSNSSSNSQRHSSHSSDFRIIKLLLLLSNSNSSSDSLIGGPAKGPMEAEAAGKGMST
jgi:hypothetical protein